MTFAYTISGKSYIGDLMLVWGTYTNASGDTGGDVSTGLGTVYHFHMQPKGTAVVASNPVANETFPLASGDVTVVNTDNEDGYWFAIGKP